MLGEQGSDSGRSGRLGTDDDDSCGQTGTNGSGEVTPPAGQVTAHRRATESASRDPDLLGAQPASQLGTVVVAAEERVDATRRATAA